MRPWIALTVLCCCANLAGEEPTAAYLFPAGGQRGTTVELRVGGHYLHGKAGFEMLGPGVKADPTVREIDTVWFEGPLVGKPDSSRKENYPRDHVGRVEIAADATPGVRYWRVSDLAGSHQRDEVRCR